MILPPSPLVSHSYHPAQPQRSHLHLFARPQQHSATALAAAEAVGAAVEGQAAPVETQETTWGLVLLGHFYGLRTEKCGF